MKAIAICLKIVYLAHYVINITIAVKLSENTKYLSLSILNSIVILPLIVFTLKLSSDLQWFVYVINTIIEIALTTPFNGEILNIKNYGISLEALSLVILLLVILVYNLIILTKAVDLTDNNKYRTADNIVYFSLSIAVLFTFGDHFFCLVDIMASNLHDTVRAHYKVLSICFISLLSLSMPTTIDNKQKAKASFSDLYTTAKYASLVCFSANLALMIVRIKYKHDYSLISLNIIMFLVLVMNLNFIRAIEQNSFSFLLKHTNKETANRKIFLANHSKNKYCSRCFFQLKGENVITSDPYGLYAEESVFLAKNLFDYEASEINFTKSYHTSNYGVSRSSQESKNTIVDLKQSVNRSSSVESIGKLQISASKNGINSSNSSSPTSGITVQSLLTKSMINLESPNKLDASIKLEEQISVLTELQAELNSASKPSSFSASNEEIANEQSDNQLYSLSDSAIHDSLLKKDSNNDSSNAHEIKSLYRCPACRLFDKQVAEKTNIRPMNITIKVDFFMILRVWVKTISEVSVLNSNVLNLDDCPNKISFLNTIQIVFGIGFEAIAKFISVLLSITPENNYYYVMLLLVYYLIISGINLRMASTVRVLYQALYQTMDLYLFHMNLLFLARLSCDEFCCQSIHGLLKSFRRNSPFVRRKRQREDLTDEDVTDNNAKESISDVTNTLADVRYNDQRSSDTVVSSLNQIQLPNEPIGSKTILKYSFNNKLTNMLTSTGPILWDYATDTDRFNSCVRAPSQNMLIRSIFHGSQSTSSSDDSSLESSDPIGHYNTRTFYAFYSILLLIAYYRMISGSYYIYAALLNRKIISFIRVRSDNIKKLITDKYIITRNNDNSNNIKEVNILGLHLNTCEPLTRVGSLDEKIGSEVVNVATANILILIATVRHLIIPKFNRFLINEKNLLNALRLHDRLQIQCLFFLVLRIVVFLVLNFNNSSTTTIWSYTIPNVIYLLMRLEFIISTYSYRVSAINACHKISSTNGLLY